jgi:AcrR family transcriptional regulator
METSRAAPLTQKRIIAAALSLTRRIGEPPSMRRLATDLDVTPGALYRHLTSQEQLVTLMIEAVMVRVAMPDANDEADPWERIRIHVRSLMSTLDAFPGLDSLIARYGDSSTAARIRQRWLVQQLAAAGLSRTDAVRAYGSLDIYWVGSRQRVQQTRTTFYFGLERLLDGLRQLASQP